LLLDVNPVDLARGRGGDSGRGGASLFDYVNDRPYVASSFMSTAIAKSFGTAMSGRCDRRPQLAASELPLTVTLAMLPCSGGQELVERLFKPLGHSVQTRPYGLDSQFPEWGASRYHDVTLRCQARLKDILTQL